MDFELISDVSAVGVIIILIQVAKSLFKLNPKLAPIVAIILGIGASFAFNYYGDTMVYETIVTGVVVGLSAIGLFSGGKNVAEYFKQQV